jgi:GNAT superfamily N-acetyltransferase
MSDRQSLQFGIQRSGRDHLSSIAEIAASLSVGMSPKHVDGDQGFLVSEYTQADYERFMNHGADFFSAIAGSVILGFLFGYPADSSLNAQWLKELLRPHRSADSHVIKQVAVRAGWSGSGVATALYQRLFDEYPGSRFIAVIVSTPRNRRSERFHLKNGFTPRFTHTPSDGFPRGIWIRDPG